MGTKPEALANLGVPAGNKGILSIDGGGMRGIFTVQLLKKLEEVAGAPCYVWCDMVAGTSTGAIIASLILTQHTAAEIEEKYEALVAKVFTKRNFIADRYINPPKFDKVNYRKCVKEIIGDITLKQASQMANIDCMLTSKDLSAGEETFFACFKNADGSFTGTYQEVLLRAVMEATMSAPTYFSPFERFIDGGTTTYNNPTLAAVMEAVQYSGKERYDAKKLTVFSFGTGTTLRFIPPTETHNPAGPDIKFWLNYVMEETGKDASEMQIDMLRSGLIADLQLRRYQVSFDEVMLSQIPDKDIKDIHTVNADRLRDLKNEALGEIDMSDVTKFPLMKIIGESVAEFICPPAEATLPVTSRKGNWFQEDFINKDTKRGALVTAKGDIEEIKKNLSNVNWVDAQPTK
jgi:hypothetical protein